MSKSPDIMVIVEDDEDRVLAALADYDEKHAPKDGEKKKDRGMRRWPVIMTTDGERLEYGGLTRQQFQQAAIQEAQDRAEDIDLERDRPEGGYNPADYGDGLTTVQ